MAEMAPLVFDTLLNTNMSDFQSVNYPTHKRARLVWSPSQYGLKLMHVDSVQEFQ